MKAAVRPFFADPKDIRTTPSRQQNCHPYVNWIATYLCTGPDAEQNYLFALTPRAEVPAPKPTTASRTVSIVVFPTANPSGEIRGQVK